MAHQSELLNNLHKVLTQYQTSLTGKVYEHENDEHDLLMDIFSLTPEMKRENRQYWGRELGMCWQLLVIEICRHLCDDFQPALRFGSDEPCTAPIKLDTKMAFLSEHLPG
jgi:hypothetical protein